MSLIRRNPKRDANERDIVDVLEKLGFHVERLSGVGVPDLLISKDGRWYVAEVKSRRGTATEQQSLFARRARADVYVLRGVDDAIAFAEQVIR